MSVSFQLAGSFVPFRDESKHVLRRRLRRERFEPANRLAADVREGVHAADARPQHGPRLRDVRSAIQRRLYFAAQNEVRLLERMVVQADADAGLVFDEQYAMVTRADLFVD